ncbi:MAG TPA: Gfo/Idh/MocA family oxidoreductase [Bryobacteraceae bacterium]|nr:Gfo/Idh/MocA family oxidoreductase [Bryobacteraceae bacterium]
MKTTRRELLIAAAAAPLAAQAQQPQQPTSPNDHVQVALIGAGGQGMGDARASIAAGSKLVAVADVYDGRLERSKELWGAGLVTTRDYREVLARSDVDAVIIATPDHWHQKISTDAMNAGKDVYCEKPMVQLVTDGKDVIAAERKTGKIFQVGSQRVSSIVYQKAKDLLAAGAIGELNLVEAWWDRNDAIGAWQYSIPPDASPDTIDWDRFLGRAPKVPFEPVRLFRWRNYRDYGTGVAGDLFVHLFSGMHFVTGSIGPTRVYATGGLRFWNDGRDVPDVMLGLYDYPKTDRTPAFNLALRVNFVDGASESEGLRFIGSEGIMTVGGGVIISKQPRQTAPGYTIDTFAKATQDQFLKEYREKYPQMRPNADSMRPQDETRYFPPYGYNDHLDHHRNFLEAVRTRKPVVENATFGFRAAGPAVVSNISYFERRMCEWDAQTMTLKA